MSNTLLQINIAAITEIAEEAGKVILEIYHSGEAVNVQQKSDDSPVTIADQKANDVIVARLRDLYATVPILSEEEKQNPYTERKDWEISWQVDPLDGTKEFISRNGEFCVCISLITDGRPTVGVIHVPVKNWTVWAEKGQGAWMKDSKGNVRKLESGLPAAGEQFEVVSSRSHSSPAMEAFLQRFRDPGITTAGSAVKFLLLAMGQAHIYPRLVPTMEWDTSAGQIILEEAGGEVLDEKTGLPMVYNRENLRNNNFIAYAKGVREGLGAFLKG